MVLTCLIACWLISNSNAYDAFYSVVLETTPYLQPLSLNLQNVKTVDTALRSPKQYTKVQQLFEIVNEWRKLDFEYSTYEQRQQAIIKRDVESIQLPKPRKSFSDVISNRYKSVENFSLLYICEFIVEHTLPLGIDIYQNRIFITTPRWKDGVPASLGTIPFPPSEISPALKPYPNWDAHSSSYTPDCGKLISVYRTYVDVCQRLWLIDSGIVNATGERNQICLPKIVVYDLTTDKKLFSYEFPSEHVKEDSLYTNIVVDVASDRCGDAYAYVTDVWRFGIVVYSLGKSRSWRVTNFNFFPNPAASDFQIYGLNFQWLDGVFGMSLSPSSLFRTERFLYFHPMASFKEFKVSTALLQDESVWPDKAQEVAKAFIEIGDRGPNSQSSTSGIARNGVMFFTQVHLDGIACWDTAKSYSRNNLQKLFYIKTNNESSSLSSLIQFPNDLKVDGNTDVQSVWVISNRLPVFLYSQLDYSDINFRILRANVSDLIKDTPCDPL